MNMSVLPLAFSNWLEDLEYPHRLPAEHFTMGIHPEQLYVLNTPRNVFFNHPLQSLWKFYHPKGTGALDDEEEEFPVSKADKDKFRVALDVQQFTPEEIKVKVVDNCVVVEGKHDEKRDEHGSVMRQFIRKYLVPKQCDIHKVSSSLSSDGVLTLNAPRKQPEDTAERHRVINVEYTNEPVLPAPGKESEDDKDASDVEISEATEVEVKESSSDQAHVVFH